MTVHSTPITASMTTLTTTLPAAPTRKSGSQGQRTGDPGGRFQGSHRSGRGLCGQDPIRIRERWDSFLMRVSDEGLGPAHSGDSHGAGSGGPPNAEQAKSGVWVKVGSRRDYRTIASSVPSMPPLESWESNRPRAALKGPAESRGYRRFQGPSGAPKNLGVHKVSGFKGSGDL